MSHGVECQLTCNYLALGCSWYNAKMQSSFKMEYGEISPAISAKKRRTNMVVAGRCSKVEEG
jgi:hypothetical protein